MAKIVNGQIIKKIKSGYLSKKYNDSQLIEINADVFAMHYFNRLTIKVVKDNIVFSNLKDSISKVVISQKEDKLLIQLTAKDAILASNNLDDCSQINPKPNSVIRLFKINNRTKCLVFNKNEEIDNYHDNLAFLKKFVYSYDASTTKNKSINDMLEHYIEIIDTEDNSNYENVIFMAYITTDKYGKIEEGIYWEEEENNNGNYTIYKNGEIIKINKNSLENFQTTLDNYFKSM